MRCLAVANQKGGCGKTTVAIQLASCLAFLRKKVLLIDLDPQGHSTLGLGILSDRLEKTIYEVLDERQPESCELEEIRQSVTEYLELIPSGVTLSAIEQKLSGVPERERKLAQKMERLHNDWDFVMIDCPPSLGLLTFNALCASEEVLVPIDSSFFSLHGLAKILETIQLLRDELHHSLTVHVLFNRYDPSSRDAHKILDELERVFPDQLLRSVIHESISLPRAASAGLPISEFDRHGQAFEDFLHLACEVLERHRNDEKSPLGWKEWPSSFAMLWGALSTERFEDQREGTRELLLTYRAPEARCVQVAGDFNLWVAEDLWAPIKEGGVWRKLYHLPCGRYRYKFIVDGEWSLDPENSFRVPNPYGGLDSVVEV